MFDLSKVVLGILIQDELADRLHREFRVRPDLGQIENTVTEVLGLLRRHRLLMRKMSTPSLDEGTRLRKAYNVYSPRRIFALLDGLKQSLNAVVRVFSC